MNCSVELPLFAGWGVAGNAGIDPIVNFIGTTDAQDVFIRTNDVNRFSISNNFSELRTYRNTTNGGGFYVNSGNATNPAAMTNIDRNIGISGGDTRSLTSLTTGQWNIGIGFSTLATLTTGQQNTAIGYRALNLSNANFNTAVGAFALENSNAIANTAIGWEAMRYNTTGIDNVALGHFALRGNFDKMGSRNVGIGADAGVSAGNDNVFIGWRAGGNTGIWVGSTAGSTREYHRNIQIGSRLTCCQGGVTGGTASDNILMGYSVGGEGVHGNNNIIIGQRGGIFNNNGQRVNGSNNVILGSNTQGYVSASWNIAIGNYVAAPAGTSSMGTLNIGNVIYGSGMYSTEAPSAAVQTNSRIGIATNTLNYTFQAGNNTVSGIVARFQNSTGTCDINPLTTALDCSSDQRLKSNITSLDAALPSVLSLRPVTYTWNNDGTGIPRVGFIAQEVQRVFPGMVHTDTTTGLLSLSTTNLIPYTIKALQDIHTSMITLDDMQTPNLFRDALTRWFATATNGITKLFVGEVETKKIKASYICAVGANGEETCVTKEQLDAVLSSLGTTAPPTVSFGDSDVNPEEENTETEELPIVIHTSEEVEKTGQEIENTEKQQDSIE